MATLSMQYIVRSLHHVSPIEKAETDRAVCFQESPALTSFCMNHPVCILGRER